MNNPDFVLNSCYFLFYSFAGWLSTSLSTSILNKKLQNRGLLYGPWLPSVGIAAVIIQTTLEVLPENIFISFFVGLLYGGIVDFLARILEEKYLKIQPSKYNIRSSFFNGKVNVFFLLGYGLLTVLMANFFNPVFRLLMIQLTHPHLRTVVTWVLGFFFLDFFLSIGVILQLYGQLRTADSSAELADDSTFHQVLNQIREGRWLALKHGNLKKSYNNLSVMTSEGALTLPELKERPAKEAVKEKSFATGLNFYKLFWVFLIACVMGFIIESIWCVLRYGRLESRQGLIYGPFSQVYGIGAVAMTIILSSLLKKGKLWVFLGSGMLGGLIEVVLSYFQEACFGSVSWHYSAKTLGVFGGRTSLLYMLFWGFLGLFFIQKVFPKLSELIEAIPNRRGIFFTWIIALFLVFDVGVSVVAVYRWSERDQGVPAETRFWKAVDHQYPDWYMKEVYPNMQMRKDE